MHWPLCRLSIEHSAIKNKFTILRDEIIRADRFYIGGNKLEESGGISPSGGSSKIILDA
jgi:hypothetical protein